MAGMTQAELARALEVSPVTINRWENDDPRYKPSDKERRLLEALDELMDRLRGEAGRRELRDLLRVSTIAGVIGKAAIGRLLKESTITLLAATPGLGWLGLVADIGVGAALPFFSENQISMLPAEPPCSQPVPKPAGKIRKPKSRSSPAQAIPVALPEPPTLYSLNVETL
jgi:transcriptional regulator with XRE-family HTH domain